jgi:polysaccharide biosynthesis/export protein
MLEFLTKSLRRVGENTRFVAAFSLLTLVGACSTLPGSGPTKQQVIEQETAENGLFTIIELNSATAAILQTRQLPSFRGQFGDYRPAPDQRIGTGDSLTVTIFEAAAGGLFSAPAVDRLGPGSRSAVIPEQIVSRDGSITVPYAGRVRVAGLRPQDVERTIVERLKGKAIEPQALVAITRNASNVVTVSGEVGSGALVPLNVRGQRLLDVIALAGGVRSPAHETFVNMSRGGRSVQVPFQTILSRPAENVFVRPGDVVTLLRAPITFTAVGATGQNAVIPFGQVTISLEEAVAKAGGLLDFRADPEGVFVLRYEPVTLVRKLLGRTDALPGQHGMTPVVYKVNLRDANALFLARLFYISDKDIIYVANAPLAEVQKLFTLISTLVSPAASVRTLAP